MRGSLQAIGIRPMAAKSGRRWPGWIAGLLRSDPVRAQERVEVIERLASERRAAMRAGEYVPEWSWQRRWR